MVGKRAEIDDSRNRSRARINRARELHTTFSGAVMSLDALPAELLSQIIEDITYSSIDDQEFYSGVKRSPGLHCSNNYLASLSSVSKRLRLLCIPILFLIIDAVAYGDEFSILDVLERLLRVSKQRPHVAIEIACVLSRSICHDKMY
jgi:hypothetical protein